LLWWIAMHYLDMSYQQEREDHQIFQHNRENVSQKHLTQSVLL
jgi:hypothetical protein